MNRLVLHSSSTHRAGVHTRCHTIAPTKPGRTHIVSVAVERTHAHSRACGTTTRALTKKKTRRFCLQRTSTKGCRQQLTPSTAEIHFIFTSPLPKNKGGNTTWWDLNPGLLVNSFTKRIHHQVARSVLTK